MPGRRPDSGLGPWEGDDLTGTVRLFAGAGVDEVLEDVPRFGRNVGRLALRRARQHLGSMRRDAIAIFLLHPARLEGMSTKREPMLGDGGVEICGRIWFVNETAQSGRWLDVASADDDDAMFNEVIKWGLGHVAAVVFNPKVATPAIRIYGNGLSAEDDFAHLEVKDQEVSLEAIRSIIDFVSERRMCTPDAQVPGASMWADPVRFHATRNAEAIAQLHVLTGLSVGLFGCDIRHEQRMRGGRVDLEVVQSLANGLTVTPAEIEIKVLRERNSEGRRWSDRHNHRWIRRGVRQAAAYRDDRGARAGMLCCFDMRDGDRGDTAAFDDAALYAEELGVTLHRNFLFNDSESWRAARYG